MAIAAPVRFTPDVESVDPNEDQTVDGVNETFDQILTRAAEDYRHAVRAVHAKAHGILKAKMIVRPHLRPELGQGLFATAGEYEVYMRLSTNAGDILPDAISLPRGMAMKILGVSGERLPGAEGSSQDFIMVNDPTFQAKDTQSFERSLKLLAKTTDRMEGTKKVMSSVLQKVNRGLEAVGVESSTLQSLGGAPNVNPLGETYYSVTPFRYGDFIAKFSLAPVSSDLTLLQGDRIDAGQSEDAIRETVQADMRRAHAVWEFRVQLCRDLDRQPVEDPTVEWDEKEAPFETVATIVAEPQDSWDAETVRQVDDAMRFSVWTGLEAHRPLGNINRARRRAYEHSAAFRARFNRCPIHEPAASETSKPWDALTSGGETRSF